LKERKIWDIQSKLAGIDFNQNSQVQLLKALGQKFGTECNWSPSRTNDPVQFYTDNPSYGGGCAAVCHSLIRELKPKTVIEIGSGMSSLVIDCAIKMNREESNVTADYLIVDPYPGEVVKQGLVASHLIRKRVELLDASFVSQLGPDDILFIDSGHSVRMGGDVNFLYLDVIPELASGVFVHIHDIRLPHEYSRRLATNERFRQFWTEQYLLQAFLSFNSHFEVVLALNYLMVNHKKDFLTAFPHCELGDHPSSFWMKRIK
jgi:hypothetical protein